MEPIEVVALLNELFVRFDRLVQYNEVYKVETINDSYMIVSGAPEPSENHAEVFFVKRMSHSAEMAFQRCANVALGMLWEAHHVVDPLTTRGLQVVYIKFALSKRLNKGARWHTHRQYCGWRCRQEDAPLLSLW